MDLRALAALAADQEVSPGGFLPVVAESLDTGDSWLRAFAVESFAVKVMQGDARVWEDLCSRLADGTADSPIREYLTNVAKLAYLFINKTIPNRDAECGEAVLWLIQRDPSDQFLENPFCYDFMGEPYERVGLEWRKAIDERPNDVHVVANAAEFFCMSYPDIARTLFMRCRSLDPTNPRWEARLAEIRP